MSQMSSQIPNEQGFQMNPEPLSKSVPFLAHISFSFAFGIIFLIEILLFVSLGSIGYMGVQDFLRNLEEGFQQRGRGLALSLAASGKIAYKKKKFSALMPIYKGLARQENPQPGKRAISEIFLLEKNGVIPAHSDPAMVTSKSKDPIGEITLKYNNEFFHSALLLEEGQVTSQKYPYSINEVRHKASFFLQSILPERLDYSMDFSSPVVYKKKKIGTVHVVMNRTYMYDFLISLSNKFLIMTGIVMAAGLLIGLILLLAFVLRARYLHNVWQSVLSYKIKNEMMNHGIASVEEKVRNLEHSSEIKIKNKEVMEREDIQDAIYLD